MNPKKIEIIKRSNFKPFQSRMMLCMDIVFKIDGVEKKARFGISGVDMSVMQASQALEKISSVPEETLVNGVNKNFEMEDTYYFEFTGSHFQELDNKPDWANDFYRH